MRILHVNIGYPPFIGGAQVFVQQVARRLAQRGHRVEAWVSDALEVDHLWSHRKGRLPVGQEQDEGVVVRRFAVRHLPALPYSYHALRRLAVMGSQRAGVSEAALWRMARYTPWLPSLERSFDSQDMPFDLVHGWNIPFESLLGPAWRCARRAGIPFVLTPLVHLGGAGDQRVRQLYTMRHQMSLIRGSDAVIALTAIEADYLVSQGVAAERVRIVSGGVDAAALGRGDAARFRARHGIAPPFVLYIGALNEHKGATYLVQALGELRQRGYDGDLVMLGQPMAHFQRFYDSLPEGWRAHCHLLGAVSEEDKADALAACAMLALPSRTESFGLVYLEAWAAGKPVIGARAGAVPAVVEDGVDGLLVPFGDAPALAAAIARLLDDPALAQRMGAAGQRKVRERFTWERAAAQLEELYRELAGGGG